ncbi:sigma-54-dependent Fis family transcriptional regulator [Cytobacillus firmus]|uniref:sigma-54 interaction domain-containing protein n=1 Tax=Cytobacillus firmus TaxID=1399 RepID=UPI001C8E1412|nr:sigma 54-interacting transcriptional regulator [Cytobacillus firmus]MBX9973603.1 sigma 54-interacting transcriptional regulator [Cytobacillus firmus]
MIETKQMKHHNHYEDCLELEAAIHACQEGIYICDADLKCVRLNSAYTRITGLTEEELIGRTSIELEENGTISKAVAVIVKREKKVVSLMQKFRSGKNVLVTGTPVYNKSKLFRIVITARDLSELTLLENQLNDAEERSERYLRELSLYKEHVKSEKIVANSPQMKQILNLIPKISKADSPVLLLGESGTGKEVLARLIHETSNGGDSPFIKVNCGAIPGDLLESELFGYVKGAFTGASEKGKPGLIEIAENGSLFLDEVGELPLKLQVKLLRVLQDFEVTRLGSTKSKKVSFRLICATNRPLKEMMEKGEFREDLFYRINVLPITIPPLRERKEDIIPFILKTTDKLSSRYGTLKTISTDVFKILESYRWPGNIRELENVIERIFIMTDETSITVKDLPSNIAADKVSKDANTLKEKMLIIERDIIEDMLKQSSSLRDAAKKLGVDASTLTRKCQKYGIFIQ